MVTKQQTGALQYPSPDLFAPQWESQYQSPVLPEWPKQRQPHRTIAAYHERTVEQVRRALIAARDCIEASPTKLGGIPVLRGTRFSVAQLFAEMADGDSVSEIADNFELDVNQIAKLLHALSMYLDRSSFK